MGKLAIAILGLCCVFWGFSFPAMQIAAAAINRALASDPVSAQVSELAIRGTFNGWRFGIAGLLCLVLNARRFRHLTSHELHGGLIVGAFFGAGMLLQVYGLKYTLPSVSSFLTALPIYAPLGQALVLKRPVGRTVWTAVAIAVVGIVLLSVGGNDPHAQGTLVQHPPVPHLGEMLTIVGTMMFAGQILSVDRFGQKADPSRLTTIMLLTSGVLSLLIGLSARGSVMYHGLILSTLSHDRQFVIYFAGLVLVSSVLALQLMNTWQPRIPPATATVVYCLEPVFGTLFSILFGTEALTPWTVIGGAVILAAVMLIARGPRPDVSAALAPAPITGCPTE
jgi:drug/metabolite transporter (DMT)-like permease